MRRKIIRFTLFICFALFLTLSYIVARQAHSFTHYYEVEGTGFTRLDRMSQQDKLKILLGGFKKQKPKIYAQPSIPFEEVFIQGKEKLSTWFCTNKNQEGIVILFHGYGASKSSLIRAAEELYKMHFSVVLVDFRASGTSSGLKTTIGYDEADDVKLVYDYVRNKYPKEKIVLFGKSMGAAAITRAISMHRLNPTGAILECPFATMDDALENRFAVLGLPKKPFSDILLAYGSVVAGINGFKFNPQNYANDIKCPTLLHYGAKDNRVTQSETNRIFKNLSQPKTLTIFENSGHESYLYREKTAWLKSIKAFLDSI